MLMVIFGWGHSDLGHLDLEPLVFCNACSSIDCTDKYSSTNDYK